VGRVVCHLKLLHDFRLQTFLSVYQIIMPTLLTLNFQNFKLFHLQLASRPRRTRNQNPEQS